MVKLYIESMKLKLKSQLEYRLSFILTFISQIGVFFTYYFMTVALFQRFDNIKGFTLYEVLLCFSIIHFGFAFNETFFRGVDKFDKFIIDGSLDRLLVRPRGVLYQVICSEMDHDIDLSGDEAEVVLKLMKFKKNLTVLQKHLLLGKTLSGMMMLL